MKNYLLPFAILALLFACTPEDNKNSEAGETQNNPNELTVTGEALDVTDYSATLTGYANLPLELGDAEVGIMYDKQQSFESAKKVVATGLDGNNKFTVTATGLEPSTTYYFKSYVQNGMAVKYGAVKSFTTKESTIPAGAVDLGIVKTRTDGTTYKLYWAKSNLSDKGLCTNPEDYGDYYAWCETEPKTNYSWSTLKFYTSSPGTFSKYNTQESYGEVDNKTVLDPEDDAAYVKLGGNWRMPTYDEWTELRLQCTWTWTTQNGVNGRLVTGKNGNSIFLPAAGFAVDTDLEGVGYGGYYWSSSLNTGIPSSAWHVDFYSDYVRMISSGRWSGKSVRPVSDEGGGKGKQYVTSISLDKTSLPLEIGAEATLSVTSVLPDNANDKTYSWSSSDSSIASVDNSGKVTAKAKGKVTIKATANDGSGVFASCSVEVYRIDVPQAVDMGMVVNGKNVKWASFNLGASRPEEYGLYFAWGETSPKGNYSWSTYELCNGSSSTLTKYNNSSSDGAVDNKSEFKDYGYEDDAARKALGGKWRVPTDAEWTELREQCTWEWTSDYNGTGEAGRIVTAPNGNSIFLPAAGYRNGLKKGYAGSGCYWSSSLYTGDPGYAWDVFFDSGGVYWGGQIRCCGQCVRPVSE